MKNTKKTNMITQKDINSHCHKCVHDTARTSFFLLFFDNWTAVSAGQIIINIKRETKPMELTSGNKSFYEQKLLALTN